MGSYETFVKQIAWQINQKPPSPLCPHVYYNVTARAEISEVAALMFTASPHWPCLLLFAAVCLTRSLSEFMKHFVVCDPYTHRVLGRFISHEQKELHVAAHLTSRVFITEIQD